jgi:hypothetical protein
MRFDFEEEIVVGGRPSVSLWFSVVLALQPSFYSGGCFTRMGSSRSLFAFYTASEVLE